MQTCTRRRFLAALATSAAGLGRGATAFASQAAPSDLTALSLIEASLE